jgi:ATP-dependent Clp protease ATP-binding subunit ClpA
MISEELNNILGNALHFARSRKHEYVTVEHVFFSLLTNTFVKETLEEFGADVKLFKNTLIKYFANNMEVVSTLSSDYQPVETLPLSNILSRMVEIVESSSRKQAHIGDLLIAMYEEEDAFSSMLLKSQGIEKIDILEHISSSDYLQESKNGVNESKIDDINSSTTKEKKSALEKYCINLSVLANSGKIDPVIGRDNEIKNLLQTLCRRRKNNPILVGEAGVGKTAIAEGLALCIKDGLVPEILENYEVIALDVGSLVAGTKFRGDFEKRIKEILSEIQENQNYILFIDEIHTIIGAGSTSNGSMDISNLLKPALARGELKCIGATTYSEYKTIFEKDKALSRRFANIDVNEPTIEDSIKILVGLKSKYEDFHNVKYSHKVLESAVNLSARYINDKHLPDKAIDVIDEVGASFHLKSKKRKNITIHDIEAIIAKMANVPTKTVGNEDKDILFTLEKNLNKTVLGQSDAIKKVVQTIKMSKSGLKSKNRPMGVFLFTGTTGVGKTQLALDLSKLMNINFERFDMSEYMEKHAVSKLIGSPAGYIGHEDGGLLTNAVKKHPYSLILLDEVEKANEELLNLFLQVFDNASLTDSTGVKVDFSHTIIVMTSNLGASSTNQMGFASNNTLHIDKAIDGFFSKEFQNRLDFIVKFNSLSEELVLNIIDKEILNIKDILGNIDINLSLEAKEYLLSICNIKEYGARETQRVVEQYIKTNLSDFILSGKTKSCKKIEINLKEDELDFQFI